MGLKSVTYYLNGVLNLHTCFFTISSNQELPPFSSNQPNQMLEYQVKQNYKLDFQPGTTKIQGSGTGGGGGYLIQIASRSTPPNLN